MPAVAPPAVIVHGDSLSINVGPIAEITDCYFNGDLSIDVSHGKKVAYTNRLAHQAGFVRATPQLMVKVPVILKQETGTFSVVHPGTALARNTIPLLATGNGHGFPVDPASPGKFLMGDISHKTPVGVHSSMEISAELILFSVSDPVAA